MRRLDSPTPLRIRADDCHLIPLIRQASATQDATKRRGRRKSFDIATYGVRLLGSGPSGLNGPCRFNSCLRHS